MKIKLDNIVKKFYSLRGKHEAVKNLNLEVYDKEFFVFGTSPARI